jgi:prophage DNA circulation protein
VSSDPLAPLVAQPDVRAAVDAARAEVDGLLGHRLLRRRSAEVSAEAALRTARASAALAGVDVPLAAIRSGTDAPVVQAALRVTGGAGGLQDVVDRAPLQALARLHALAARGLVADDDLGRPREGVSARLAGLADLLAARRTGSALVLAAVVHGELLTLDAFPPVTGLVARAAARLVLVSRGLDPKAVVAVDVGHRERSADYAAAQAAYAEGDAVTWVVHVADAVRLGAIESVAICEALLREAETQV